MNCCCENGETNDLKIEADVRADPIWCKSVVVYYRRRSGFSQLRRGIVLLSSKV